MKKITNLRTFLIYLALVAGMLILTNLVSRRLFFRWDLTENNIYTLSASSKAIIAKLDDRLLAKVFFSDNLPGQYANNRRYLQDILEEFQAYSKGQLHFEFYRPEDNDELESEAQRYGIPPMQLQAIENDRMEIKNVWMGLALLYEDKREVLPVIQTTSGLEYELASAIKKLIDTDRRSVGIVVDPRWEGKNQNIRRVLGQTYDVRRVHLEQPVPADIDLLLVNGVMDSLPTTKLYNLDQYVMSGRPLLLAQNQVDVHLSQGRGVRIRSNFPDVLRHYGVEIKPNIIADRITGRPSTKDYGPISILLQLCGTVHKITHLPPQAFWPTPKVESTALRIDIDLSRFPDKTILRQFSDLLRLAFSHRRKTLNYNLRQQYEPADFGPACAAAGIDPGIRAEALSPEQWYELFRRIAGVL